MKHMTRRVLPALLAAVLCLTLMLPVLAGVESPEVTLTVTLTLDVIRGNPPADEVFSFILIPDDSTSPKPASSVVSRKGAGTVSFGSMVFDKVGIHTYTLKQIAGNTPYFTYDRTEYKVTISIINDEEAGEGLVAVVSCRNKADLDDKCEPVFVNAYDKSVIQPSETEPEETEPPETKPAETEPPETKPVETEPPETKPVETEPEETEPEETEPEETEPEETESEVIETEPEEEEILVQTGQLNWPISVLSVGGMGFAAVGCVLLTGDRSRTKKEKEETDGE